MDQLHFHDFAILLEKRDWKVTNPSQTAARFHVERPISSATDLPSHPLLKNCVIIILLITRFINQIRIRSSVTWSSEPLGNHQEKMMTSLSNED